MNTQLCTSIRSTLIPSHGESGNTYEALNLDRLFGSTKVGHLKRLHVENINTLELSEQLEALKTGSLLLVGGNLTLLGTLALDYGWSGSESECRRSKESRGRGDRRGGHAQSGGRAGNEAASGEEHVKGVRPDGEMGVMEVEQVWWCRDDLGFRENVV